MEEKKLSCIDCGVIRCNSKIPNDTRKFPDFCLTTNMDEELLENTMKLYEDEENLKISQTSAGVECDGYLRWTRVEETIVFAKRMGYQKLGIATCAGLMKESRTLAQILRKHGLEVYGVACKCGMQLKEDIGCAPGCSQIGPNMCNPILQAKLLEKEQTDFNIVMGLCVGHDSLFYKYSKAPVTTLVAKDRVLAHNPAAALYQSEGYYKRLNQEEVK